MAQLQTQSYDLLTQEECAQFVEKLHGLRASWIHHESDGPEAFTKTLGYPIYLDPKDGEKYRASLIKNQQLMQDNFGDLYAKVRSFFEGFLNEPVRLAPLGAVPGFHIFDRPMPTGGLVHFDMHHNYFNRLFNDNWDLTRYLSFTLPLKLPQNGAGLTMWNVTYEEFKADGGEAKMKGQKAKKIPYETGKIFVLTEHLLHKMAPDNGFIKGDERITLQGHLLRHKEGHWALYW